MSNFTICVTGFTGYIGSHFVSFLKLRGFSPFLIGRKATQTTAIPTLGCRVARPWTTESELQRQLMDLENPVIVNLAGCFASDHKAANFSALVDSNFGYSSSIIEAISDLPEAKMVNIGTSWEFDDIGSKSPTNLYAQLKACTASVADWYALHHDIRTINLKLNDTFGGQDNRAKLMPILKSNYMNGTVAELKFSSQLINLLHITDVCEGLLHAAQRTFELSPQTSETAFLFGKESVTLLELVRRINALGSNVMRVNFQGDYPAEQRLREIWQEAPLLEGWQPKLDLNQALSDYFIERAT